MGVKTDFDTKKQRTWVVLQLLGRIKIHFSCRNWQPTPVSLEFVNNFANLAIDTRVASRVERGFFRGIHAWKLRVSCVDLFAAYTRVSTFCIIDNSQSEVQNLAFD